MIDASSIGESVRLPCPPSGWFDYGYSVLMDDNLALIRTPVDFHAESRRLMEARRKGNKDLPRFGSSEGTIRISVFDGTAETNVFTVESGLGYLVDQMADGRWLVVSYSEQREGNGRIYAIDGSEERGMDLGYGIENLMCAPDGTIWVGYFDEGVFRGPNDDGSWPVSGGGIVQFDALGNVLWSFNQQVDHSRSIADCYAMALSGSTLWACYYEGFPIVQIDKGTVTSWRNEVFGLRALAVEKDMVILAGGFSQDASRLAVVRLQGSKSHCIGSMRFKPPEHGYAGLVQGRGSILHIVDKGVWTKVSVQSAFQAIHSQDSV